MTSFKNLQSGVALSLLLGLSAGAIAPIATTVLTSAPAVAQSTNFTDVSSNYWASEFIRELAARDVIAGFPDGTFRPNDPVTRAQFAAMVRKAFQKNNIRGSVNFVDVPSNYWAYSAIQQAYQIGFLSGYPGNVFRPNQNIPREQVLVSLANGLNYSANNANAINYYSDASAISSYARSSIAAATEQSIVVNYPNVQVLNPGRNATRAEVAAFIYQALASAGNVAEINSPYIVSLNQGGGENTTVVIPQGTTIPVRYDKSDKILVTPDEKAPLTLTVAANITTNDGQVLIPAGTQISGQLQPASGGSQFVAQEIVLNGQRVPLSASSQVITKTETIRKGVTVGNVLRNAVYGAAAAAAVSAVTGDRAIATEEVLGGAGIGSLLGLFLGRESVNLIVVEPDTDLNLTLTNSLTVNR